MMHLNIRSGIVVVAAGSGKRRRIPLYHIPAAAADAAARLLGPPLLESHRSIGTHVQCRCIVSSSGFPTIRQYYCTLNASASGNGNENDKSQTQTPNNNNNKKQSFFKFASDSSWELFSSKILPLHENGTSTLSSSSPTPASSMYISPQQISQLASRFDTSASVIQEWLTELRYAKRKAFGRLTREQKNRIKEFLSQNDTIPSKEQLLLWSRKFQVGERVLQHFVSHQIRRSGKLPRSVRGQLREWLNENEYSSLSGEVLDQLEKTFKVPASRIRYYLYQLHYTRQRLDKKKKSKRKAMVTSMTRRQKSAGISNDVASVTPKTFSNHQRTILRQWIEENNYDYSKLSDFELDRLSSLLMLPPASICDYLRKTIHDKKKRSGKLSSDQLYVLRTWIQNHSTLSDHSLEHQDLQDLCEKTGLSSTRIRAYFKQYMYRHNKRAGSLSVSQREKLQKWLSENNYESLHQDELHALSQELQVSEARIREYLYKRNRYSEQKKPGKQ